MGLHELLGSMCAPGRDLYVKVLNSTITQMGPIYKDYQSHMDKCEICKAARV